MTPRMERPTAILRTAWGAAATLAAQTCLAQTPTLPKADPADLAQQTIIIAAIAVAALVALGVGYVAFISRRHLPELDGLFLEPTVVGSKFEQLLAEIQGLTLRVQGGESRGYYRKIEQLVRVFLERLGFKDARHHSDEEIKALLSGGKLLPEVATALQSIFDQCKQGASHETEKLDFSASDLLKELRAIVKRVEKSPARV